jgi:hypothetical protein
MNIGVLLATGALALFVAPGSAASHHIFIPFGGERVVEMVDDDSRYGGTEYAVPCGVYFGFRKAGSEEVVTFRAPLMEEDHPGTNSFVNINRRLIDVEVDDSKPTPTAEWVRVGDEASGITYRVILRMSRRDYEATPCLAR